MEETAWLIEDVISHHWMCKGDGDIGWTKDPNKPIRFAREQDAKDLISIIADLGILDIDLIVTKHSWGKSHLPTKL